MYNLVELFGRFVTQRRRPAIVLGALTLAGAVQAGVVLAGVSSHGSPEAAQSLRAPVVASAGKAIVGHSLKNDVSPPLRSIRPARYLPMAEHEASPNPRVPVAPGFRPDAARQAAHYPDSMPEPILTFDGIAFPGVSCNCAPPDTNGEVGLTQYVQIVNEAVQVFDKTTGSSLLGPIAIAALWQGFGGLCQNNVAGDPVVLYDQLANRWLVTQFAGIDLPTDECIAVSQTGDATGAWNRYDFHLGHQLLRLPAPRGLAGRLLHGHERLQLVRDDVHRPAAVRVRPRRDAVGRSGDLRHLRHAAAERTARCFRATSTASTCRRRAHRIRSSR